MSALLLPALAAGSSGQGALYVDDVFSTDLYTGNGSAQTVSNGIDLVGNGGLVWIKERSGDNAGTTNHALFDTVRGRNSALYSNQYDAHVLGNALASFNSNGFTLGLDAAQARTNDAGDSYVSWTFRRAPKFFDIVTWTGNYNSPRNIAHGLGASPGLIIARQVNGSSPWLVKHRVFAAQQMIYLNSSGILQGGQTAEILSVTSTYFQVGTSLNQGGTYIAYVFGHDTSADGAIQCGSFTTDSSGNATVNLGWANGSQFAMIKATSTTGDWEMYDTARTSAWSGNDARLRANLSNAEDSVARISASGTSITFAGLSANSTYIYMAIRSPS